MSEVDDVVKIDSVNFTNDLERFFIQARDIHDFHGIRQYLILSLLSFEEALFKEAQAELVFAAVYTNKPIPFPLFNFRRYKLEL